jgi:hypothetical protein
MMATKLDVPQVRSDQAIRKEKPDGTKAHHKCVKKDNAKCPAMAVLHIASSRIVAVMHEHGHQPENHQ